MPIKANASILATQPDVHGGPEGGAQADKVLIADFSVNSNPFGPPVGLLKQLKRIDISTYPDPSSSQARELAAKYHGCKVENISFGNGTAELIHRIAATYLSKGDKVLVFTPTFGEYARASKLYGAQVIEANVYAAGSLHFASIQDLLGCYKPKLVFLCHPNNPTGQVWSFELLERLGALCSAQDALLIIDAAYLDLSAVSDKRLPTNCLQLHSLTKSFRVAGVRAGYALAPQDIIKALNQVAAPWQASTHAQGVAVWAFSKEGQDFLAASIPKCLALCAEFQRDLLALGFKPMPSQTPYFLLQVGNAALFKQEALKAGFRLRDCSSFALPHYVRLATQLAEHNKAFLTYLSTLANQ